jgi:multiple sugar transport system permease protein
VNSNTSIKVIKGQTEPRWNKNKLQDYAWAYLMIGPTIIGLWVLNMWPIIQTIHMSFMKAGDFGKMTFVGLKNYSKMFADPMVRQATINTFGYTLGVVPIGILLSLIVAVLLNAKIKGKGIYRTIYFLPVVSTPAAIAMVWKWLYNSDYGLINFLFGTQIRWLTSPKMALISIIIVGIWSTLGYNMILLLAGLQEIPNMYYEAAEIDGAGPVRKFFSITLPLVSPTLFFVVVLTLIGALQVIDYIYMMIEKTNPTIEYTQSLVYLFYKHAFMMNDKGYASAIIVFLFVIILLITIVQLRLQKKWVHYQ